MTTAYAENITGKVVAVLDGDTVDVLDDMKRVHRIRLSGIDAPEKSQAFGQRSKEHLSNTIFSKTVIVESTKQDKYGRTVGKILVNGVDANLEQVVSGFAWHYKEYAREQSSVDRDLYSAAEVKARSRKVGLWHDSTPVAPWDFRHGDKSADMAKMAKEDALACPCTGVTLCTGSRGGTYCVKENGKKRY
jgi:micrococcal nuclease